MKKIKTLLFLCLLPFELSLAAENYVIDSRHTFPSFEISHLGFSMQRGRFNKTTGTIMLDPEAGRGEIDVRVEASSISTGLAELEEHLRSDDFFAVEKYPEILFSSNQLQFKQGQLTRITGMLTLHGQTRPVSLFVDHFHCGIHFKTLKYTCGANASGTIKRSDFGVDKYAPLLADEVKLMIQVEAIRQ